MSNRPDPPVASRFRKGESGNPKGRPRKTEAPASAFDVLLARTLTLTRNGVEEEVGVEEALAYRTLQAALAGDRRAVRDVLKMIVKRQQALEKLHPRPKVVFLPSVTEQDPANADPALLLLGIATPNPDRWHEDGPVPIRLEPWAVEAAFRRRMRQKALPQTAIEQIRACTRDPDSIRWPKGEAA